MATQKSTSKFIQNAIKRPGDLRRKAEAAGAITRQGYINKSWARRMARGGPNVDRLTQRQAAFFINILDPINQRKRAKRASVLSNKLRSRRSS